MPDRRAAREKPGKSSATKTTRKSPSPKAGEKGAEAGATRRRPAAEGAGGAGAGQPSTDRVTTAPRSGGERPAGQADRP
ncbi:MAG: hypothetical protein ACLP5E_01080, partial [Streptosporangiaceae bacterium]